MNKVNIFSNIIFDFDGTIADTLPELIKIIKNIAANYGYNKVNITEEKIKSEPIKDIVKEFGISFIKVPFIAKQIIQEMHNKIYLVKPVDSIIILLKELKKRDYKLNIISSNSTENIKLFLKNNKINNIFDSIYSDYSIFGKYKVIERFLKKNNLKKDNTIYIGDETRDIEAAKKVDIKIIAVTWGFNSKLLLEKYKPDFIADKPSDILEILNNY